MKEALHREPRDAPTVTKSEPPPASVKLIADFAAQLGLAPQEAEVRFDTRPRVFGARGIAADGVAHVDPQAYPAGSAAARALLAHEMTHLAQLAGRGARRSADADEAEREARRMGERAASLLPLFTPSAVLPKGALARDMGTAVASHPAEPAPPPETTVSLQQGIDDLADNLSDAQEDVRDDISALLDGIVFDSEMTEILRILDAHDFITAGALICALPPDRRARIPGELDDQHYRNYARSVMAAYAGLARTDVDRFDEDNFDNLPFASLSGLEVVALDLVLGELERQRPRLLLDLTRGDAGDQIMARVARPYGEPARDDRDRAQSTPANDTEPTEAARDEALPIARDAHALLRENETADTARQVLDMLRPLAPVVEPEQRSEDTTSEEDGARPLDEFGGALRTVPPVLEAVAREMARLGTLEILFRATDRDDALGDTYGGLFFALMARRPVWANLAYVQELLSRSFFDWAIRNWEAQYAYRLLRAMPLEAQYRFRQLEGGVYYRRLEEEIPRDLIRSGVYVGIEVTEDETGQLVSTARDYAQLLEQEGRDANILRARVNDVLEFGAEVRRHENWERRLFEMIWSISTDGTGFPHQSPALGYVVRRLDTYGVITPMIDGLPDDFLYAQHRRPVTMEIFLARDPVHLVEHARDLMSTNWWPWSLDTAVTDRDAYVAFRLIRALPPHEREQFLNRGGGEELAEMWSELHRRMRDSRDMHLFVARDGGLNREDVLARLAETDAGETLWTAERRFELDAQIRLAISFGAYDRVFGISRDQNAYRIPELSPIIERYRLFDRRPDSRRTEPDPDALPTSILSTVGALQFLQPLGRALYLTLPTLTSALDLFFFGSDFLIGRRGGGFRVDLERALNLAATTFDQTQVRLPEGGPDREERGENENTGMVWFDLPQKRMHLRLPDVRIDGFNDLFGTTRVETGPVSIQGLNVTAHYADALFSTPRKIEGGAQSATVTSGGMLSPDTALTFGEVALQTLALNAETAGAPESAGESLPDGAWIPLPFMFLTMLGLFEVYSHVTNLTEDETIQNLTGRDISFDRIEIRGFATSDGSRLRALTISDFNVGIATTPDQYIRRRIAQVERDLDRMSAEDRNGADGRQLDSELRELRDDLPRAEETERERQRLAQQHRDNPDSLSDREVRRLVALERARRLGVTVDIGEIEAEGVRSGIDVDRISLQGISGHGQGQTALRVLAAAGLDRLADPAALGLFRERLDHEGGARETLPRSTDDELNLAIARVEAEGVGFTYVPSVDVVNRMISISQELATSHPTEPLYDQTAARLQSLLPQVAAYHELADRDTDELTYQQRIELARRRRELRAAFYIRVTEAEATGVTLGGTLTPDTATIRAGFESFALRDIRGLGIRVDALEGEQVDLSLGLLVNMLQRVIRGQADAGFDMVASGSLDAGRLTLRGAHAEAFGVRAESLEILGLESSATRLENGWRIEISQLDSLTLDDVALRSGQHSIVAPGHAVMTDAQLVMHVTTDPQDDDALREIRISGQIGRLAYEGDAGPMVYQGPAPSFFQPDAPAEGPPSPPRRMRVEVRGGALGGIRFEDLRYRTAPTSEAAQRAFAEQTPEQRRQNAAGLHGGVRVQTIDALRVAGLVHEAFSGGEGTPVTTHAVEGTITNVPEETPPADAAQANALEVDFVNGGILADEGTTDVRLNEVDLSDGMLVIGDNRVNIRSLGNLGADVSYSEDLIEVRDLSFDDLAIGSFRWRTEEGVLLEARRSAHVHGFSLAGRIERENGRLSSVRIDAMRIRRMTAGHFHYHDPERNLTLTFDNSGVTDPEHQSVELDDLRITGLNWTSGIPSSGEVHLGRLRTYFDAALDDRFSANGSADAQNIDVRFRQGGRAIATIGRFDAEAEVTAFGQTGTVAVENLRTGEEGGITYTHGQGLSIDDLQIGSITLSALDLRAAGMHIQVPAPLAEGESGPTTGTVTLSDIALSADVDFQQSEAEDAPPFQELRIRELFIPRISAEGLSVTLPEHDLTLTLPAGTPAVIENVRLSALPPELAFRVTPEESPDGDGFEWLVRGALNVGRTEVPSLLATVVRDQLTVSADVGITIPSIEGAFFGDGTYRVSLNQPSVRALLDVVAELEESDSLRIIVRGALGAENVIFTEEGVEIRAIRGGPFVFRVPDLGITIRVRNISGTPSLSVLYNDETPDPGANWEPHTSVRINELDATGVDITIDDVSALMPDSEEGDDELDLEAISHQFGPLLDSANGQINFDMFAFGKTEEIGGVTVVTLPMRGPIRVAVSDGRANLRRMQFILLNDIARQINDSADGLGRDIANSADLATRFTVIGDRLHFQYWAWSWKSIVSFGLGEGENTEETPIVEDGRPNPVRLSTFLRFRMEGEDDAETDEDPGYFAQKFDEVINAFKESAHVRDIDIALSLSNSEPFDYRIGDAADEEAMVHGILRLAPDTLEELRITGDLPDSTLNLSLRRFSIQDVAMTIAGAALDTGSITMNGLGGQGGGAATLDIEGWLSPKRFEAGIQSVNIRNLVVRIPHATESEDSTEEAEE